VAECGDDYASARFDDGVSTGQRRYLPVFVLAVAVAGALAGARNLAGVKEVTRTLQAIARDRNRMLDHLPL
jgi:hypothetical protein